MPAAKCMETNRVHCADYSGAAGRWCAGGRSRLAAGPGVAAL